MTEAEATLKIKLVDQASRALRSLQGVLGRFGVVAAGIGRVVGAGWAHFDRILASIGRRLLSLTKYAALAGVAFAGWQLAKGVQFNAQLEQWTQSLTVLMRSSVQAKRAMEDLRQFAERTPFQLQQIVPAATQLESAGLSYKRWLQDIGDLAAATGRDITEVAGALRYLVGGRTGEAFERFGTMGLSRQAFQAGGLKFDAQGSLVTPINEALDVVQKVIRDRFGGMMERQSKTLAGRWSTFKDNVLGALGRLTGPLSSRLKGALEVAIEWVDKLASSGKLKEWGDELAETFDRALKWVTRLQKKLDSLYEQGGIKGVLKGVWAEIEPLLVQAVAKAAVLAVQGAKVAIKGIYDEGWAGKAVLGGLAFHFMGGTSLVGAGVAGVKAVSAGGGMGALAGYAIGPALATLAALAPVILASAAAYSVGRGGRAIIQDQTAELARGAHRRELEGTEAYWGRAGGRAGVELLRREYEKVGNIAEASLAVHRQVTQELGRQAEWAHEMVSSYQAQVEQLDKIAASAQTHYEQLVASTEEKLKALRLDLADPLEKQKILSQDILAIEKQIAEQRRYAAQGQDALAAAQKRLVDLDVKRRDLVVDRLKLQIQEAQKAQEANLSLASRLAGQRPEERFAFRYQAGRLAQVQTPAEFERLLGNESFQKVWSGNAEALRKVMQPGVFERWAQQTLGPSWQPGGDKASIDRLIASVAEDVKASAAESRDTIKYFAEELKSWAKYGLGEAIRGSKLEIAVAVEAKLDQLLKLDPSESTVERFAQILTQATSDLEQRVKRDIVRRVIERLAANQGSAEREETFSGGAR